MRWRQFPCCKLYRQGEDSFALSEIKFRPIEGIPDWCPSLTIDFVLNVDLASVVEDS